MRADASRGQRVVLYVAVGVVFAYLLASAWEPLRLNWGDPWSDANVLTALNYSSKYGFFATSFTDILDVGPLTADSYRYTHYPPFAEIFYGCVRKIAGGQALDITVYRLFAIAFAGIGLHAFHRYVSLTWGKSLAAWATVLCATNLLWIQFADAMHQAPILFASGMTALAAVPAWARGTAKRLDRLALAAGTYVCFLTAYDYYFFLPTVVLLTARILGVPLLSKRMIKLAAFVALSGALAIVTKSIFVSGALGFKGFLEDVHFQFLERATTKFSPDYKSGFLIIILLRWTAYFTPGVFLAAGVLVARLVRRASLRSLLVGENDLSEEPASILILLAGGLPFILVFSELSVEQVLPSQVITPFFAVGVGYLLMWLAQRGDRIAYAGLVLYLGWQGAHMSRIPKTFLDRDSTEKIAAYLRENDTSDFLVTNLMSDGPIQYFFQRHLHMPAEVVERTPTAYMELASRSRSGIIHAVYYDDPGTRLIDKSLWYLLPRKSQWAVFGAPYILRKQALGEIEDWDDRVLEGLRRTGMEVLTLPGVHVFRIGVTLEDRAIARRAKLMNAAPTRYIDFGTDESDVHKLDGFRFTEHYPGVPGFCWTVARGVQKSYLTKRGLEFRSDGLHAYESRVLLRFEPGRDHKIRLITWGAIADQTMSGTIDGKLVLPTHNFGPVQTRQEVSFVVPKEVIGSDPVKEILFEYRGVADYGGGVAFAIMHIDPVAD